MTLRPFTLVAVLLLCACEEEPPPEKELTCEILEDEGNCWAETAVALRACLPEGDTPAILAADRASCTYADGTEILFEEPLPLDTFDLERFAFTIKKSGAVCGSFDDTFENRMEMTAGGDTVSAELRFDFELTCDDGQVYSTDFDTLFECAPGAGPTDGFLVEPELVSFSVIAISTPGEMFRCVPAAPE